MKDTKTKEIKIRPTIGEPFNEFKAMNLAFVSTLTPGKCECSVDRSVVSSESIYNSFQ
jgi:hypothetical protein